ncbi:PadR family transcriptional regulator [Agromyces italicus]|uniref:PadR family transcriptional regulator n=1 Tax=Agromyces italicus TaxID=279572 RepID=UPI0003B7598C|nr:helix-turn-helix transcriptional regulator [Agromyces italicus]
MAVREALLAILLAAPAYGFQLHGALATRTGGRRRVNVGQSYATLERASKAGLIESAGATADGLPLHRLTEAGARVARAWLDGADASGADPWDETVDRVLIAASLPEIDERPIVTAERERWRARLAESEAHAAGGDPGTPAELARLAAAADAARARAAIGWLEAGVLGAAPGDSLAFAPTLERPRRGRRPAAAPEDPTTQPSAIA